MKTFEFIYLATGHHYRLFFKPFIDSLENFCTDTVYKKVKLITDDPNYDIEQYKNKKNINVELYNITHYPWPLIMLFKFHYMEHFLNDEYDMMFFCNANYEFKETQILPSEFDLTEDKFLFFRIHKIKNTLTEDWTDDNPFNKDIPYVQATMFAGKKESMKKCIAFIKSYVNEKLLNREIPFMIDEEVLNKYFSEIYNNKDEYNLYFMDDYGRLNTDLIWDDKTNNYQQHINGFESHNNQYFTETPQCKPLKIK